MSDARAFKKRYVFNRGVVRFTLELGEKSWPCWVSEEVLEDDYNGDHMDAVECFKQNEQSILQIAWEAICIRGIPPGSECRVPHKSVIRKTSWEGSHGLEYEYDIYEMGAKFNSVPATYICAKLVPGETGKEPGEWKMGGWKPVYISQTDNMRDRWQEHPNMQGIKGAGAKYIHVHIDGSIKSRNDEVRDLIKRWRPECNK